MVRATRTDRAPTVDNRHDPDDLDGLEDFVAAWDIAGSGYLPAFVLVSALFTLTGAGAQPVGIDQLATTVRQPPAQTRALAGSLGDLVALQGDLVYLRLGTTRSSPRFRVPH